MANVTVPKTPINKMRKTGKISDKKKSIIPTRIKANTPYFGFFKKYIPNIAPKIAGDT